MPRPLLSHEIRLCSLLVVDQEPVAQPKDQLSRSKKSARAGIVTDLPSKLAVEPESRDLNLERKRHHTSVRAEGF
jgi:hypothetical protein